MIVFKVVGCAADSGLSYSTSTRALYKDPEQHAGEVPSQRSGC